MLRKVKTGMRKYRAKFHSWLWFRRIYKTDRSLKRSFRWLVSRIMPHYVYIFLTAYLCLVAIYLGVPLFRLIYEYANCVSSFAECKTEGVREFGFILSAALGAPFILWRTNIRQNELEIKKKMQVNDAYHNAINQLGAVNIVNNEQIKAIDIRLGSMYTLEKIAQDHEDYHNQIMEVLCAYIRTQKSFPHNLTFDSLNQIHNSGQFSAEDDINTALQVIGRRNVNHDQNLKLNFTCCDLSFARFVGDFKFAIFTYSVLNFVTFKCDLSHASMNKCLLLGTDFTDSISEDCDIARSFIRKITISDPQFLRMRNWKVSCRPENLKHGASIPYPDQSMRNRFDTPTLMKELKL